MSPRPGHFCAPSLKLCASGSDCRNPHIVHTCVKECSHKHLAQCRPTASQPSERVAVKVCPRARGGMWLHTHAYMTNHIRMGRCALSRASKTIQYGGEVEMIRGQAGVGSDSVPGRPTPGRPPVAACAGLRPIAARVPTGGAAAAEADRPAQPAGAAPASPVPGSHCSLQSRGAGPGGPGRGERLRMGRCVSVLRCGVGAIRGSPPAQCSEGDPRGDMHALPGSREPSRLGSGDLSKTPALVPAPRPTPGGFGVPPSAGLCPTGPAWPPLPCR